jgi:aminoglycoside 3-N-acetyltransferase
MCVDEKKFIYDVLSASNIRSDSVLLVHSSFSSFSKRGFRVEAVIEALLSYLVKGTLLMPTMTWRTVTPANPIFDLNNSPSHTGILSEIFRTQYSKYRSLHPTHSVAGYGMDAEYLLSSHHIGNTPVPANSPYGLMRDLDSNILFLGVGFEMCTAIHHVEEQIDPDKYLLPEESTEVYDLIDNSRNIYKFSLRRHRKLNRDFPKFENQIRAHSKLASGENWKCISLCDLYKCIFSALLHGGSTTLAEED